MATVETIFNLALSHVGNKGAITDRTESPVCELHYPTVRDSCLTFAPWTFNTVRQKLVRLDDSTMITNDFAHQYLLPTKPPLLRTIDIDFSSGLGDGSGSGGTRFGDSSSPLVFKREIFIDPAIPGTQQPVLLTDADEVVLKYSAQISEGVFPPLFTAVVALWLATDISQRLSGKASLRGKLFTELQAKLLHLRDLDGHQDTPRFQEMDNRYLNVRDRTGNIAPFTGQGSGV